MSQLTNHTLNLRFIPNRAWLALGSGWAALAGVLAAGGFRPEADILLKVGLLWLLADPILGTIWDLLTRWGVWRHLTRPDPPPGRPPKLLLPYVAKKSAGYQVAVFLTHLSALPGGEGYTLVFALLLAMIIATLLGLPALAYALISISLALIIRENIALSAADGARFWQSVATFLLPYLLGLLIMENLSLYALLLGGAYWVVYLGRLQLVTGQEGGARVVVMGQGVVALLFFALTRPLVATAISLATLFSLLLRLQAKAQAGQATLWFAKQVNPLLWLGLLIAAVALGMG